MVLESLINPAKAEGRPSVMIALGFVYASIAIALSIWVFFSYSSMIFVFLTAMATIPLIVKTIKFEEAKDMKDLKEIMLLYEHSKALRVFMCLFLGITLAGVLWYTVLPQDTVTVLFESQIHTISGINSQVTGEVINSTEMNRFGKIFANNIKVMLFCLLFSFLYGAGAIFILSWNASVIAAAIGNFIRGNLASYAHLVGLEKTAQYFQVISIGLFKYVIHGVPEILGFFVAGLAGGIISVAVIKHDFGTRKFEHVLLDSADLILIAIGLIFVAAILEVWVTPIIF